jgi:tetratricopeptide (TPR) repeat protein
MEQKEGNSGIQTYATGVGDQWYEDIDESISKLQLAISLTSPGDHASRAAQLSDLGLMHQAQFDRTGDLRDIDESISTLQQAISLSTNDASKATYLTSLGFSLQRRFNRTGDLEDIGQSTSTHQHAISLIPDGHASKATYLTNLNFSLLCRFHRTGDLGDIDQSISTLQQAISLSTNDHASKATYLTSLGFSLQHRFSLTEDLGDIDLSILTLQRAVSLTPIDHADRAIPLSHLGISFQHRFICTGDLEEIDQSISTLQQAISLTPNDHAIKAIYLSNLGLSLQVRFDRTGHLGDIDQSISTLQQAISLTPNGHAGRAVPLSHLGVSLRARFDQTGHLGDIDDSISMLQQALPLTPNDRADRAILLSHLGVSLQCRFNCTGDLGDIDQSISALQQAVSLTPNVHPSKTIYLSSLGLSFLRRFVHTRDLGDIDKTNQFSVEHDRTQAIEALQTASKSSAGSPNHRFRAAKNWTSLVKADFAGAIDAHSIAMGLLPDVVWLGSTITQRYDNIRYTLVGDMVSDAVTAAIAIQDYPKAVEWLEEGRSIIWGQLLNLRSPLDDLRTTDATRANRLKTIHNQLEELSMRAHLNFTSQTWAFKQEAQHHRRLAKERQDIINEIRMKPGFKNFLQPMKFAQLAPAAQDGPVVMINVHPQRCDALILKPGDLNVTAVPLPHCSFRAMSTLRTKLQLVLKRAGRNSRKPRLYCESHDNDNDILVVFKEVLYDMWSSVVKPVLEALDVFVSDFISWHMSVISNLNMLRI